MGSIFSACGGWWTSRTPRRKQNPLRYPNLYIEFLISALPIPVDPWRSVQNGPNAFVTECFIDELAHAAGKDPLEFRLSLLKEDKRAQQVLQVAAEKAGWGKPLSGGRARGLRSTGALDLMSHRLQRSP